MPGISACYLSMRGTALRLFTEPGIRVGYKMAAAQQAARTHLINRKWVRWLLGAGWQGATKEHSLQGSVTEEQRSQPAPRSQPSGLPIFAATASLLVSQRSLRIFSFLAPRGVGKSLATHPFPIYEMGSSVRSPARFFLRRGFFAAGRAPLGSCKLRAGDFF